MSWGHSWWGFCLEKQPCPQKHHPAWLGPGAHIASTEAGGPAKHSHGSPYACWKEAAQWLGSPSREQQAHAQEPGRARARLL